MKPSVVVESNTLGAVVRALVKELRQHGLALYPEAHVGHYPPRAGVAGYLEVFRYDFFIGEPGSLRNVATWIPDVCAAHMHVQLHGTLGVPGRQWYHGYLEGNVRDIEGLIADAQVSER